MKKTSDQDPEDDLRPEYDFRNLRVVARGPGRRAPEGVTVQLAPDVADAFPDSDTVNDALRLLIQATHLTARKRRGVAGRG
jgi:hypothetical protein